jgi:hypothetical protein
MVSAGRYPSKREGRCSTATAVSRTHLEEE